MQVKIVDVEKTISVNNERICLNYDFFLHVDNKMINTTITTEFIDFDFKKLRGLMNSILQIDKSPFSGGRIRELDLEKKVERNLLKEEQDEIQKAIEERTSMPLELLTHSINLQQFTYKQGWSNVRNKNIIFEKEIKTFNCEKNKHKASGHTEQYQFLLVEMEKEITDIALDFVKTIIPKEPVLVAEF